MMKNKILSGILMIFLVSCSGESFLNIDPAEFNESISERTDLINARDLMKAYYTAREEEGSSITISESQRGNKVEVVLVHDRLADDSVRGIKIIMTVKQHGSQWEVLDIKKQYSCYEGRGHTDWGTEPCG